MAACVKCGKLKVRKKRCPRCGPQERLSRGHTIVAGGEFLTTGTTDASSGALLAKSPAHARIACPFFPEYTPRQPTVAMTEGAARRGKGLMATDERRIDRPQPGFYRLRLCRGGPWSFCRIAYGPAADPETGVALDRPWLWEVWQDGLQIGRASPDPVAAGVMPIWIGGQPITEAEYRAGCVRAIWAREHRPDLPEARPERPVNIGAMRMKDLLS